MYTLKLSASDFPVESVTVYKTKAEVIRTFDLELKSEQNKVEIDDLPSDIDADSVRVSGLGNARLFDVFCTSQPHRRDKVSAQALEAIRLLEAKKADLEAEKQVRIHEADLLLNWSKTLSAEHVNYGDISSALSNFVYRGKQNAEALSRLSEQLVPIDREIQNMRERRDERKGSTSSKVTLVIGSHGDDSVSFKLSYIISKASWHPVYELHASSKSGGPATSIALHYRAQVIQSTGEDWTDASLTLSAVEVEEQQHNIPVLYPLKIKPVPIKPFFFTNNQFPRGGLFNSFNNAASTAPAPTTGGLFGRPVATSGVDAPPAGNSLFGGSNVPPPGGGPFSAFNAPPAGGSLFGVPSVPPAGGTLESSNAPPALAGAGLFGSSNAPPPTTVLFGASSAPTAQAPPQSGPSDDFVEISSVDGEAIPDEPSKSATLITETPLSISYSVEGQTTIPSDGLRHQVPIAILPFDADVSHIVLPRIKPVVHVQCRVKNTSEYRLLPGNVSVLMDGSYVSRVGIKDVSSGETFDCTLGVDPAIKISYQRHNSSSRTNEGTFAETLNIATYTHKIIISNTHQYPLSKLVVKEGLPLVSPGQQAKVVLKKPLDLAEAKEGQEVEISDQVKVMWSSVVDEKGGEKDGMFEWHAKVGSGEKVVLDAEWEVRTPAGGKWMEYIDRNA